ncbi:MAG: sigma 54-interacting transcriptional regulator, partial [Clostridia bacterium]|nr:sigma 54-interacting transcriptional regulator [Clostridia bacterium]
MDHHKLCGTLVILNDVQRAQRLVQKITGRGAKFTFKDIVGKNVLFQETVRQGLIAARSDSNVLLLGESGTGKDVLAQAIHNESYRRNGPFVAINCG